MSGIETKQMIDAYYQERDPIPFFAGMFRARPQNFHTSEEVEIDIVRSEEDVAIVIQDLSTGYRMNSADKFTNKSFKPPVFMEAIPINAFDLLKRMPGQNPFESPDFRANVVLKMFAGMRKVQQKIVRAIELQSSQVLQTGIVTLSDSAGTALYTLDYKPKASHFPTASVSWATATLAQKIANLQALIDVVNADGLNKPDTLIFGADAWENLIQTSGFSTRFDMMRADLGSVTAPETRGNGGTFHGTITIGSYRLDVWTYTGRYTHPQTGVSTPFMDPGKVVVRSSTGRMDASFGAIPNLNDLLGGGARLIPELPARMSSVAGGMDMFTNVWKSADGSALFGGIGSRPLMIPVAIDTFGCLETQL